MGGQIIEKLYANIPHTPRNDTRGARISQQKTVLISCTSEIFSVPQAFAYGFWTTGKIRFQEASESYNTCYLL